VIKFSSVIQDWVRGSSVRCSSYYRWNASSCSWMV